jgi:hypothetical protein
MCLGFVSAYCEKRDFVVDQQILTVISEMVGAGGKSGDLSYDVENMSQGYKPKDFSIPNESEKFTFARMSQEVLRHILSLRELKSEVSWAA